MKKIGSINYKYMKAFRFLLMLFCLFAFSTSIRAITPDLKDSSKAAIETDVGFETAKVIKAEISNLIITVIKVNKSLFLKQADYNLQSTALVQKEISAIHNYNNKSKKPVNKLYRRARDGFRNYN